MNYTSSDFLQNIKSLILEIQDQIDAYGRSFDSHGEYHVEEEALKNEFIENISKGQFDLTEIREISQQLYILIQLDYERYYC